MTQPDTAPTAGDSPAELAAVTAAEKPALTPTLPVEEAPEGQVRLSLGGPFYVDSFVADGSLTIDRSGVLVDEDAVASIVASASKAGIALKVGPSA